MSGRRAPEKWVWTEADFDCMGWHDCVVHALAFRPEHYELLLDLDYIFEWVKPEPGETHYRFWIAPVTLVFENAYNIRFDIETDGGLQLFGIERGSPRCPRNADVIGREEEWEWTLDANEGCISFFAAGFKQYVRASLSLCVRQSLDLQERGGFSFAQDRVEGSFA